VQASSNDRAHSGDQSHIHSVWVDPSIKDIQAEQALPALLAWISVFVSSALDRKNWAGRKRKQLIGKAHMKSQPQLGLFTNAEDDYAGKLNLRPPNNLFNRHPAIQMKRGYGVFCQ